MDASLLGLELGLALGLGLGRGHVRRLGHLRLDLVHEALV
jgi:hypothetical protein